MKTELISGMTPKSNYMSAGTYLISNGSYNLMIFSRVEAQCKY